MSVTSKAIFRHELNWVRIFSGVWCSYIRESGRRLSESDATQQQEHFHNILTMGDTWVVGVHLLAIKSYGEFRAILSQTLSQKVYKWGGNNNLQISAFSHTAPTQTFRKMYKLSTWNWNAVIWYLQQSHKTVRYSEPPPNEIHNCRWGGSNAMWYIAAFHYTSELLKPHFHGWKNDRIFFTKSLPCTTDKNAPHCIFYVLCVCLFSVYFILYQHGSRFVQLKMCLNSLYFNFVQ